MRDPYTWSVPLGRPFGIAVRVHVAFLVVAAGLILRWAYQLKTLMPDLPDTPAAAWVDVAMLMGLLLVSVLLHEFGHCLGARLADGDAHEVLLWPLGGLAPLEVPHTARANFITAAAGPLMNLALCLACGLVLFLVQHPGFQPPWNPFWWPCRVNDAGAIFLWTWEGDKVAVTRMGIIVVARLFYLNWFLFWINTVLVGFPLDGARMLQSLLWPRLGFHQAMVTTIYAGIVVAFIVAIIAMFDNEVLIGGLALFIGMTCWRQWVLLMTGGEESLLGYDFSQGYTSLERDQPPVRRRKRPNFYQRWQQRRNARRLQHEQEVREAEERRMDELLEKVQREGLSALTDEERRFLKRVSDKYRNRQ